MIWQRNGPCSQPYGKRKRCYLCEGKNRKTGETKTRQQCRKEFYIQQNELNDPRRKGGLYCSRECHHKAMTGRPMPRETEPPNIIIHANGYLLEWVGYEHPGAKSGRMLQHRLVMERHLGRHLMEDEEVHHINEVKTDNRIDNLQLVTSVVHQRFHDGEGRHNSKPKTQIQCQECGAPIALAPFQVKRQGTAEEKRYCSMACKHKAWGRQMGELRHRRKLAKATA